MQQFRGTFFRNCLRKKLLGKDGGGRGEQLKRGGGGKQWKCGGSGGGGKL